MQQRERNWEGIWKINGKKVEEMSVFLSNSNNERVKIIKFNERKTNFTHILYTYTLTFTNEPEAQKILNYSRKTYKKLKQNNDRLSKRSCYMKKKSFI